MSEHLVRSLVDLSERGSPRGASAVLREARRRAEAPAPPQPTRSRPSRPAFAIAAAALVTLGGLLTLNLIRRDPVSVDVPAPDTTMQPTTTTIAPEADAAVVGLADDVAEVALAPDGTLWTATAAGVVAWDIDTVSPTVYSEADGLGGRSVDHIAVAADGTVWAAGDGWLTRYDGTWTSVDDDVLAAIDDPFGDLAAGPDGAAWVAVGGEALVRIDADGATTHHVPEQARFATPWARSIAVEPAGTVWASTWGAGVLAFDGEWRHYGTDDGLPSAFVGNIAVAPDGSVWVGGDGPYGEPGGDVEAGGILRYQDGTWTVFTTADGLLADGGDVAIDPTGGVWVTHAPLPDQVAEALGVGLAAGISHFDGAEWRQYTAVDGRGPGVVSGDGILWLPSPSGVTGFDGRATVHLTVGPEAVPAPVPAGEPTRLEPATGLAPVRLSTSIGEIEFATWVLPDGEAPPLWLTGTDHGVIGDLPPNGTPAWSTDGVVWTEIHLSAEPSGWSDQAVPDGDELVVFTDAGVARLAWDGTSWVETELLPGPSTYMGAAGPAGIVAVDGDRIHYWNGDQFAVASQSPDRSLHRDGGGRCRAPGWTTEGIMAELGPVVATDGGYVALASRSESDWYRTPVCEPLVWLSTDGDQWAPSSAGSPFGRAAFVHELTVVEGRLIAVGGLSHDEAALWVSDDGIRWERAELEAAQLWHVAGGDRGWIAVGNHSSNRTADLAGDMWFSPDGLVWDGPYERPPGWADGTGIVGVAMLDDLIVGTGEQYEVMPDGAAPAGVVVGVFIDD
jgi:hypothetical protein